MTNQIHCEVIADSLAPSGARLFTVQATYPRFVHLELMTHRAFSRNASSSRAIPVAKQLERVMNHPAMPIYWGLNQKGMQASQEVVGKTQEAAMQEWLSASNEAVNHAERLMNLGLHKQIVNRVLEPFSHITTIISATEWANFFYLRCHKDAQPEMRELAMSICRAYYDNKPVKLNAGEWHLPYIKGEDWEEVAARGLADTPDKAARVLALVSTARCARVSYLTQDGKRDILEDLNLSKRLEGGSGSGHWSPFEHPAMASSDYRTRSGNFFGWVQLRELYAGSRANWSTYLNSPEEYYNRQ